MILQENARQNFVDEITNFVNQHNITGIDFFSHTKNNLVTDDEAQQFYSSFAALIIAMRSRLSAEFILTVSYTPNGQQEHILSSLPIVPLVDFFHIKAFDMEGGGHHAPIRLASSALANASVALPAKKLSLGLPLFGRNSKTNERVPYEYLTVKYDPINHAADALFVKSRARIDLPYISFNGRDTIMSKAALAVRMGLGGVSLFEVGCNERICIENLC